MSLFIKSTFGLDISDYSIEALQLKKNGRILAFARVVLEPDIVKDGNILNKEKLGEKINQVISKAKIKSKRVVLSLPESKVFIHNFSGKKNIEQEAAKTIPWKTEQIYSAIVNDFYVCVPRNIIDDYVEVLKKNNLKPVVFEIEAIALARALKAKECLIIDVGARTTNLSIFDKKGNIKLSGSVNKAGNHFTKAISEKLKVSLEKAKELKEKYGLDESKRSGRVMLILQKELQPIIEEIKKIIAFYPEKITKVLLVGGSAKMPKISNYFSSNLGLEVKIGKSPILKQSVLFNTVIGLALRNPKKGINLLPDQKKKLKKAKAYNTSILSLMILALIFLGGVIYQYIYKADFSLNPNHIPRMENLASSEEIDDLEPEVVEITTVVIKNTPTGWLRVRSGPGTNFAEIDRVFPGESFPLLEENENWYKIELEGRTNGWISAQYTNKIIKI